MLQARTPNGAPRYSKIPNCGAGCGRLHPQLLLPAEGLAPIQELVEELERPDAVNGVRTVEILDASVAVQAEPVIMPPGRPFPKCGGQVRPAYADVVAALGA